MPEETHSDNSLELELEDQRNVEDAPEETLDYNELFQITSYGADYTVDSIANRMNKGHFIKPDFQRSYIWKISDASRFIESLLMGLPVPSIFLFKEHDSPKHVIVDGLQRLTTIDRFYKEKFVDKVFKLTSLKTKWNGKSYSELTEEDQLRLDDSLIHVTIFKQENPLNNKSVYEVFERINTGGIKLSSQEIRNCVSYGPIVYFLREMNRIEVWRKIYGKESMRLKDQELILRFFAFLDGKHKYKRPLKGFLNDYMDENKKSAANCKRRKNII